MIYQVKIKGPEPDEATRTFLVQASSRESARERALDEVTGEGEFWPPSTVTTPLEGELIV